MATKTGATNAIALLKEDHDRVKELFRRYKEAGEAAYAEKRRLAERIFKELEIHSALEEELFYPSLRNVTDEEGAELISEGVEEHHVVDLLIHELKQMDPRDETYDAKLTVLCENVEHHIEEEEGEMFPDAQRHLRSELDTLGERMQQRKRELQA